MPYNQFDNLVRCILSGLHKSAIPRRQDQLIPTTDGEVITRTRSKLGISSHLIEERIAVWVLCLLRNAATLYTSEGAIHVQILDALAFVFGVVEKVYQE